MQCRRAQQQSVMRLALNSLTLRLASYKHDLASGEFVDSANHAHFLLRNHSGQDGCCFFQALDVLLHVDDDGALLQIIAASSKPARCQASWLARDPAIWPPIACSSDQPDQIKLSTDANGKFYRRRSTQAP